MKCLHSLMIIMDSFLGQHNPSNYFALTMQLRDDKAHAFAMTFKDRPLELGELAFGLLANNLRFVVPNRNESNKSRWKTCRFWERFLEIGRAHV